MSNSLRGFSLAVAGLALLTLGSGCRMLPEYLELEAAGPQSKVDVDPSIRGSAYDPLARGAAAPSVSSESAPNR